MTNHSDAITYHVVTMQMVVLLGNVLFCISPYANLPELRDVGTATYQIFQRGQILFHCLTAVDRYLAVVHPITYLGMKTVRVVRIRNIVIGCVWVFSFGWFSVIKQDPVSRMVTFLVFMVSSLIVVSFCSISVLRALIRPGPGQGGGETGKVDQSKQRAFYAMMAITGALSFWFVGYLVATLLILSRTLNDYDACILTYSDFWFTLPSSLVIPLLFLQRAGKLRCCC